MQQRSHPDPRSYVGKGKLEELKQTYGEAGAEVLLVDDELDPTQQRTLENALDARVVDRTQLILDIFAQHAKSAEGKLQVELAQLEYNLPRMRGMWKHLERLGGGTGALGAGVGTRGPGESQLETDRRLAGRRISLLRRRLRELGKQRGLRRKARTRSGTPTVALAGYTNVGKSTLLNALTGADVSVDDRLFETSTRRRAGSTTTGSATSSPTPSASSDGCRRSSSRASPRRSRRRSSPTWSCTSLDASVSDDRLEEMIDRVDDVLREIGADEVPVELVLNKIDRVDPLGRRRLANRFPGALQVSAATGEGSTRCASGSHERFADRYEDVRLLLPYDEGGKLAELYALGRADRGARGRRGRRCRSRPPAAARGAALRRVPRRGRPAPRPQSRHDVIELAITRLRPRRRCPSARTG